MTGNERLPTEIGWKRRTTEMQGSEREKYTQMLQDAGAKYAPAGTGSGSGSGRPGLGGLGGLGGLFGRSDEGIRFVH